MKSSDRWRTVFSSPGQLARWERYVQARERKIHSFLQLDAAAARQDSAPMGPLAGVPFAVKDNIAVRGFRLTCGSRLLRSFLCPYTATAVRRLQAAGAVVVGKTNLDEFGMGSSTENSALAQTANPWDLARVPGGSSGGSAAAVAAGMVPFALGSDTGGSVRQPAAFCGVYGLKPTYGAVSRYGLVAYASSLEGIGIIARELSWIRAVFLLLRGRDPLDHSSVDYPEGRPAGGRGEAGAAGDGAKGLTVGILRLPADGKPTVSPEAVAPGGPPAGMRLQEEVQAGWEKTLEALPRLGFRLQEIELPTLEYVVSAYYVIACAEASANLARFDGIRYGERAPGADNPEELVRLSRSRGLGEEVKLRILLGTYVLRSGFQDQYYLRAQRIRTALRRDLERLFSRVDLILTPVYPCGAFKRGTEGLDPFAQKLSDIFTCLANLAGLPAMSFPVSVENGLPVGLQLMAPAFQEERLFQACECLGRHFPVPESPLYGREWEE